MKTREELIKEGEGDKSYLTGKDLLVTLGVSALIVYFIIGTIDVFIEYGNRACREPRTVGQYVMYPAHRLGCEIKNLWEMEL